MGLVAETMSIGFSRSGFTLLWNGAAVCADRLIVNLFSLVFFFNYLYCRPRGIRVALGCRGVWGKV